MVIKLSIFKKAFNRDINIIRVLYIIFLTTCIGLLFSGSKYSYEITSEIIASTFETRDAIIEKSIASDTSKLEAVGKLKEQYRIIAEIKKPYLFMAEKFNSYGYAFTILFAIFSVISGILGSLILKKGWDNTENFYLKSSFMVVFFCSTLFGILPNVFDNKENVKNNLTKYNYFNGLQLDVYDLIKDNRGFIKRHTPNSLDSLNLAVSAIVKGIKDNQDLYFDTHIDKIPTDVKPFK